MIARKCKIPLKEKLNIINQCDSLSRESVAQQHLLSPQAVNYIIKNSDKFIKAYNENPSKDSKGVRTEFSLEKLETEVSEFVLKLNNNGITVHGEEIRCYALRIASDKGLTNFKASRGWLLNFCQRKGIKSLRLNGQEGLVDGQITKQWFDKIKVELNHYSEYILLNADETSFEYHNQARRSYIHPDGNTKNVIERKERVTLFFCVSSVGEKFKPLVIGKSEKPRCFKNKDHIIEKISYRSNQRGWMTSVIFTEWLIELDNLFRERQQKAILFIDNFAGHTTEYEPTNILLMFLPPNTTSVTQPLDAGVIRAVKSKYRKTLSSLLVDKYLNTENTYLNNKKVDLAQAIEMISESFNSITEKTIMNCWKKCNLIFD
ncbi:tigger transposable element-derived protein 6-like [Tetranychus urticae]|uniref:tigger transposable element-derived protein 6-like n=1 Tax=Tetranychus urticae TaxID=32264 RepID=UPI00077BE2FD|nr:tigger transposable element-derived protein 6-like [Tetranychus urticae]